MNPNPPNRTLAASQAVFKRLLFAYPKAHRDAYGADMMQLFRDQSRDAWQESRHLGLAKLWLRVLPDLARTSLLERLSNLNPRKTMADKIDGLFRVPSPTVAFFGVAMVVFLLTLGTSIVITFLLPESYSSSTRIKVEKDPDQVGNDDLGSTSFDPYFIQTTFEIMQSEMVLNEVIASLDLNEKWGKKFNNGNMLKTSETISILKNSMVLTPVRNTKLITITVYSDDPKEAAQIANTEAEAYTDYRVQTRNNLTATGLKVLQDQYASEELQIQAAQSNVDNLRQTLKIVDSAGANTYTTPMKEEEVHLRNEQLLDDEKEYTESSSQLSDLKAYNTKQLRDVLPSVFPDQNLQGLLDKLHEAEQNYAVLTNDYSLTNVVVLRVKSEMDALNGKIDDRVTGLMAGISSKVDSQKAVFDNMTKEVNDAKESDLADSAKNQPYYDAKRDLDQLTEQHRLLYLKMDAQRIDSTIPKTSMVQVVDPAEPDRFPVKPNKPLNIFIGIIGGGFLGLFVGTIAMAISLQLRKRPSRNLTPA